MVWPCVIIFTRAVKLTATVQTAHKCTGYLADFRMAMQRSSTSSGTCSTRASAWPSVASLKQSLTVAAACSEDSRVASERTAGHDLRCLCVQTRWSRTRVLQRSWRPKCARAGWVIFSGLQVMQTPCTALQSVQMDYLRPHCDIPMAVSSCTRRL